jgi:TetR/AcrR family fatty acid metabolism transcriptional regulator
MSTTTGSRSLKERQRQEREDLILQAAETLLLEKGYHEMAMDEIAVRVGISKGTVYLHFPSKEDLVFALLVRGMHQFQESVKEVLALDLAPRAKLRRLLEQILSGMHSERSRVITLIAQNHDVRSLIFDKKAELIAAKKQMEQPILALLEEGQACGELNATIPARVLLVFFTNLLNPHRYMELLESGQITRDELVQQITQLFFTGIDAAPPREGA